MNHHRGATSFMVWPTCAEDSACVADFICRRNCVSWFSDVIVHWKGIESTLPMCMHYRENIQAYTTVLKQTFSISNQCLLLLLLHEGHASKASCADWRKQDRRWTSSLPPLPGRQHVIACAICPLSNTTHRSTLFRRIARGAVIRNCEYTNIWTI